MHNELMNHCQKNEGIDRHLFGLYIIALEAGMDTPEIFLDPAYVKRWDNYFCNDSELENIELDRLCDIYIF